MAKRLTTATRATPAAGLAQGDRRLTAGKKAAAAAFWKDMAYPARALRPHEVAVPAEWAEVTQHKFFPHRCFEMSFHFALDLSATLGRYDPARKRTWLVHGQWWLGVEHAWVLLPGGIIFDGVFQRFYDRKGYCRTTAAFPETMFSPGAARMIAAHMKEDDEGNIPLAGWADYLGISYKGDRVPQKVGIMRAAKLLKASGLTPQPRRPFWEYSKRAGCK